MTTTKLPNNVQISIKESEAMLQVTVPLGGEDEVTQIDASTSTLNEPLSAYKRQ